MIVSSSWYLGLYAAFGEVHPFQYQNDKKTRQPKIIEIKGICMLIVYETNGVTHSFDIYLYIGKLAPFGEILGRWEWGLVYKSKVCTNQNVMKSYVIFGVKIEKTVWSDIHWPCAHGQVVVIRQFPCTVFVLIN